MAGMIINEGCSGEYHSTNADKEFFLSAPGKEVNAVAVPNN